MSSLVCQRQSLSFRARSYMAFAFTPRAPFVDWLADLDANLERSKGFFAGHPVVLDLSGVNMRALGYRASRHRNSRSAISACSASKALTRRAPSRGCLPFSAVDVERRAFEARRARRRTVSGRAGAAAAVAGLAPDRGSGALRGNPSSSLRATSPCSARSDRAPRSSPADRFTFTGRCAAAPWPASPAMRARAFSATASRPSFSPSTAYYKTADDIDGQLAPRTGPGLARGQHAENLGDALAMKGKDTMAKRLGRDIWQRRRRQDHVDGRAWSRPRP